MKIQGNFATRAVMVNGRPLDPAPSLRVFNHSPTGFNWGYGGSGPAQLALAILLRAGLSHERAVRLHQHFKWDHIAKLPSTNFTIEIDVRQWVTTYTVGRE